MLNKKNFFFAVILSFLMTNLFAISQPWYDTLSTTKKNNFYEIQKSFQNYWKDKDHTQKGKGWKQFKRWEWFWEQRVYPSGEFPNLMQTYSEIRRQKAGISNKTKDKLMTIGTWVNLGPTSSPGGYSGLGRLNVVRENPSNSNIIWVGSASGGLWKSTNGGSTWSTNTDELASIGITDIVFDPNNSNIMYIATGDGDAGDTYSIGLLKSTDGGQTWNTTGLTSNTYQNILISRVLIHPTNSNIILACGNLGIYKSSDAGINWFQASTPTFKDMEFKPNNPNIIYASGTSIYRSTNTGDSWTQLTNGLPTSGIQRIALSVTPANNNYVYALMSNSSSGFLGLYRSTDGGDSWASRSTTPNILGWQQDGSDAGGQGWYDLCIASNQTNAEEIYSGGVNIWKSTNGGTNWTPASDWTSSVHADHHDLWFVPGTNRLYSGNDGGIYRTTNGGTNWTWLGSGLITTQFYRLGLSSTNSNLIIAGSQDNGTKLKNGSNWSDVIGGDGMEAIIDHSNANIMYGELYYGAIRKSIDGGVSFNSMTLPNDNGSWVTP
ncbi:MAG: hypothetical protein QG635_1494, partial [Bacteroidota bacterium]|nr:hypothetical protein [Bacteroidota bacterium]